MTCTERDSFHRIRAVLNHDRSWSLYALGDLAPAELMHCEWRFTAQDSPAVTLFYRAFDPPVFFAIGSAMALERLLDQAPLPSSLYLHIRPEILALVSERYRRVKRASKPSASTLAPKTRQRSSIGASAFGKHVLMLKASLREARAPSPEYTQSSARFHPDPGHLLSSPSADRTRGHFC